LQITVALAYTSDSLVIAQLLGAAAVAEYAVPEKLFSLVALAIAMVLAPLWPAYGEAIARGDHAWVRRTLKRTFLISILVASVASVFLINFGSQIIDLWVRGAIVPGLSLLIGLGLWKVVEAGGVAVAMFMNGANVVRFQVLCAVPTALLAVVLKIVLVPAVGVAGAVWASVAAYLLCTTLPVALWIGKLIRNVALPLVPKVH
jgi:O-antigen/teichoic acid export membrane protein